MSLYSGYSFFICLFISLLPAIYLGVQERNIRPYRSFLSIVFIALVGINNPFNLFLLICYIILAVLVIKSYLNYEQQVKNGFVYYLALFLALLPLVINKFGPLFSWNLISFIGISYITFRVLQVIIEIHDGLIKEIGTLELIEFFAFFPCLSSGPIDRSRRFLADNSRIWTRDEYIELLESGLYKIIKGIFYKIVCGEISYYVLQTYLAEKYTFCGLVAYAYLYGAFLFFDFAGYSLMAIGTSYILGIKTPDNFNSPFVSVDLKDFWNRWHITLSHWFRDFIFSRFVMKSMKKKWFSNKLVMAASGLIINMLIMGAWHGIRAEYIAYGLYHGIGLALLEVYQNKSKFYKRHKTETWYTALSWFVNINFIMFGFLLFSGHMNKIFRIVLKMVV